MKNMKAGFGKTDITPEYPIATIYTKNPKQLANNIVSRLYARSAVLEKGKTKVVLISVDLLALDSNFTGKVKGCLQKFGFEAQNIIICTTHTHTVPVSINLNTAKFMKKENKFLEEVKYKIVQAVSLADKDLRDAEIAFAKIEADLNVNRREIGRISEVNDLSSSSGLTDNELGLVFIKQNDVSAKSVIVNYTGHPLAMGTGSNVEKIISADYPGELTCGLENEFKSAMFLQGCAGNINVKISGGIGATARLANEMIGTIYKASQNISWNPANELRLDSASVKVPVDDLKKLIDHHSSDENIDETGRNWLESALKKDPGTRSVPSLIQVLKIGEGKIVFLPGEQFAETGIEIKRKSGVEKCFVASYANCGEIGYVPTAGAFETGAYEVDLAYKYYADHVFRNAPSAPDMFIREAVKLLKKNRSIPQDMG